MSPALPRALETLLRRTLPADQFEPIAGDLLQEYVARLGRGGRATATIALWWQGIRLSSLFARDRLLGQRGLPPIGDEIRRRLTMMESLRIDAVFGFRILRRQPGFAAAVIVVLGVGIGGVTTIFSAVDAVLWRPLPFPTSDSIVAIGEQRPREQREFGQVSVPDYLDWARDNTTLSSMAAHFDVPLNLTGHGEPERVRGMQVSAGFLRTLGIAPARGRDFIEGEDQPGRNTAIILTDGFWRRRFGARPDIIGQTTTLDGIAREVVGVLPQDFWWSSRPDVLVPFAPPPVLLTNRGIHAMNVIGRMRAGVGFDQVRADFDRIGAVLEKQHPQVNDGHLPRVRKLRESLVTTVQDAMVVLLGAVTIVLVIVCANVAMLLVARAAGRQQEIGIRVALGAGRRRLAQQLLVESLVLGALGGVAGVVVATGGVAALHALMPVRYQSLPGLELLAVDGRATIITFAAALATSVVFGSISALAAPRHQAGAALNQFSRGSVGHPAGRRIRFALVMSEIALSLVLLVGAGLLMASFWRLVQVPLGFRSEGLVSMDTSLPSVAYPNRARMRTFYFPLVERLAALPQVTAAGATTALPFSGNNIRSNFTIEGRAVDPNAAPSRLHPRVVTPGYLSAIGIPLSRGRMLSASDTEDTPPVALVNEAAARMFFAGEDPIGKRINFSDPRDPWFEIVGIVGNVRHGGLDAGLEPEAYLTYGQAGFRSIGATMNVVIRTKPGVELETVAPLMRGAVQAVNPNQPAERIRTMEAAIEESFAPRRLNLWLMGVFSAVAVLVTAAGLYGVMAYLVVERRKEIGVRRALGASGSGILLMMIGQSVPMMVAGMAIGLGLALASSRYMATMLFGVEPTSPVIYAAVSALLIAVTLLATLVPSIRAVRIDPLEALRES